MPAFLIQKHSAPRTHYDLWFEIEIDREWHQWYLPQAPGLNEVPVWVYGDQQRTQQVLMILLSNAIRYSFSGTKIQIKIEMKQNSVILSVKDQGIGIPPEKLPKIFARYFQPHLSGIKGRGGIGVGLYLAKEITERMGGRLQALSEGEGKGSEFKFELPRCSEEWDEGRNGRGSKTDPCCGR